MTTKALDLGCGRGPRNPFGANEAYGIDIRKDLERGIYKADLAIEVIPFKDNFFDGISAFHFFEHIPRVIYWPERRFCFVVTPSQ